MFAPTLKMLRGPAVVARRGDSRSRLYREIDDGTWTPPVALGPRCAAWPEHEVDALLRARIAAATSDEMRRLVRDLIEQRKQLWPRNALSSAASGSDAALPVEERLIRERAGRTDRGGMAR